MDDPFLTYLHPNYPKEMQAQDGWSTVKDGPDGEPLDCENVRMGGFNDDWVFSNTEAFQVKPKSGDVADDLWLVGRRGKPVIQVSRKDLNGGLGRPYHIDRIPWRLIAIKINRWEDSTKKEVERVAYAKKIEEDWQRIQRERVEAYERASEPPPPRVTLWQRILKLLRP